MMKPDCFSHVQANRPTFVILQYFKNITENDCLVNNSSNVPILDTT